ncbi:C2 domain-containing protein [Choanephora cucurbitarum]|nr:C2 domain-containing protein [Choanephora cucurbitarum]
MNPEDFDGNPQKGGSVMPPHLRRRSRTSQFEEFDYEDPTGLPRNEQLANAADLVPDLHGIAPSKGLDTDIDTHDTTSLQEALNASERKSVPPTMPGEFMSSKGSLIPDWYRTGWTALSENGENPGGALHMLATQFKKKGMLDDPIEDRLPSILYGGWYHNVAALFITAIVSYTLAKLKAGLGSIVLFCFVIASYYRVSTKRFRRDTRDDIQREIFKLKTEADEESVEWMNSFVQKFWLIFEPVLSALVVENLDNYISDYLPPYLDSIRLTTFTLGTKPFRVETVKTFLNTEPDTVCMDWRVSFIPNDLEDLTPEELDYKVNPKVIMVARIGKGRVGAGFPVLVENMAFSGYLRVKIKFMSRYPFIKLAQLSFLEKPQFDYVLKPLGTDHFGFDVNIIPGLQSFIREQVHGILGPLMYSPNVFTVDVDRFLAGDFDFDAANGVLAVTVYSTDRIKNIDGLVDGAPNPYIRFYLDHGQELDRTSVCENTFTPKWNETYYLKINNLNSLLSIELKTSRPGKKDRRLGTANFDLSVLDGDTQAEQEELNLMMLRNGKYVTDVRVDLRYLPISKPTKRDDGTVEPATESNSGVVRFKIHECQDLTSTAQTISPYVRLIVNGKEKKKTSVVKKSNDPKYEESYEIVALDKTTLYLRVEVRNSADNDQLLGVFTSHLLDVIRQQERNNGWWTLTNNDTQNGQIRLSADWKPMMMSPISDFVGAHGFDKPPIGIIRFTFWEARDLRNVEMVTNGKSDPYVRILSGHQIRGRTEVIENNLNPEWGETIYVPVHSLKENFILEAMDWNAKSRDKSLGITVFKVAEIIQQQIGDQSVNPDVWYESKGTPYDKWHKLHSADRQSSKGDLHFSAEFFPVLELPNDATDSAADNQPLTKSNGNSNISSHSAPEVSISRPLPLRDLHGTYIRYTPDDLVDLHSYNSGILKIHIHEVQLSSPAYCYCQVVVDSLMPQYKTAKLRGDNLQFDEYADAFLKQVDFCRVAIELKPAYSDEKDVHKLGHYIDSGSSVIRRVMKRKRLGYTIENDEGTWFKLMGTDGPARIRLSFDYYPMEKFVLNPDEGVDNQGILHVELVSAKNLMAADKSGTSDPYVVFNVNGEKVHKSDTIKKTLNPKWTNERFSVPIQSRVTASIRIEVFDWNHVKGHQPIGSGGITLRGDAVESFLSRMVDIPLDGVAGVSGSVQVKFTWHPRLSVNKRTPTSVLGANQTYVHDDVNLEVSGPLLENPGWSNSNMERISSESGESHDQRSYGRQSFESFQMHDDSASLEASTIADTRTLSDATGRAGIVTITLIEARGLRGVDKSGTSDPFVRVNVGKEQVFKTKYIPKTLNPEWNETFTHHVGGEPYIFEFTVRDHNRLRSSVSLGQSRVNIWDLIKLDVPGGDLFNQWLPLFPAGSGELRVNIQFKATM